MTPATCLPGAVVAATFALAGCAAPAPPAVPPEADRVMCTQDVMQCPDGRFVGRTAPGCRFVCTAPK